MESLQKEIILVEKVCEIYHKISKLDTLKPSKDVDTLFTELVRTCIPPASINISTLRADVQEIRSKLIKLCCEAEGLLEAFFSTIFGSFPNPLRHLKEFPYYSNYLKLSRLEFDILTKHYSSFKQASKGGWSGCLRILGSHVKHLFPVMGMWGWCSCRCRSATSLSSQLTRFHSHHPKRLAFVGSGPLPLTSIVLASYHLKDTIFHNYDIDSSANSMASHLVSSDSDLSQRMVFHTANIMDVTDELKGYDVVLLAALVGMDIDEKVKVIDHLAKYMAPGALLMLRSAHGARVFLYPVVEPQQLQGFQVLSVFHPDDDVINSVVISRKIGEPIKGMC
ncbi:unnamed protein product [Lactuca saligna]|uniref:Nicotianamine synthase n=1 Tax=Lactuca saligna TaxID=75948 RepID=A0AA35ZL57_LACSI|nr:unnamed protein product [Lactuca saligna]